MTDTQHQIYVSYADADEDWVVTFISELKVFLRNQQVTIDNNFIWYKRLLNKFDNTKESIEHLAVSRYVLIISTPDYKHIMGNELDFPNHTVISLDIANKAEITRAQYEQWFIKVLENLNKSEKTMEETDPHGIKSSSASLPSYVVITVTDTEDEAFRNVIAERKEVKMGSGLENHAGQYYTPFHLINARDEQVKCGLIRPIKKGGQHSQSLVSVLLRNFKSQLIIMTGICGGIKGRGVKLNDVIFANSVIAYNTQYFVKDYRKGIHFQEYQATPRLSSLITNLKTELSGQLKTCKIHSEKSLASGDSLFADLDSELRQKVVDLHPDILGFEMEGHGLFHETWNSAIEQDVAIIKAVSDFADEKMTKNKDNRQLKAATLAARVTFEILANY